MERGSDDTNAAGGGGANSATTRQIASPLLLGDNYPMRLQPLEIFKHVVTQSAALGQMQHPSFRFLRSDELGGGLGGRAVTARGTK
jgi:hypothetical protein